MLVLGLMVEDGQAAGTWKWLDFQLWKRAFKRFCPWLRVEGKKTRDSELENPAPRCNTIIIVIADHYYYYYYYY